MKKEQAPLSNYIFFISQLLKAGEERKRLSPFPFLFCLLLSACSAGGKTSLQERLKNDPALATFGSDNDLQENAAQVPDNLVQKGSEELSSKAEYLFMRGELLLSKERFAEALLAFREAQDNLKNPSLLLTKRVVQLHIRASKLPEAIAEAESYRSVAQPDFELLELLGGAYAASNKFPEAESVYKSLRDQSSGKSREEATIYLVTILGQMQRFGEAKTLLKQNLKENPSSGISFYYLARMHELSGDLPSAEKAFRQAVKLNPDNDGLYLELARVLASQRKIEEATELAKQVVARSPQNQAARQLLGQLLLAGNNVDDALAQLETLQTMETYPSDTRMKIALIKLEKRDFFGAENELNLIIAGDKKNILARYYLALAYAGQGKVDEVVRIVNEIPPGERMWVESRLLASFLLRQNGRTEEAIRLLKAADADAAADLRILNFLVSLQKEAGKTADAIETQKRIIEKEPKKDTNYFMLAVLYQDLGEMDESIKAGKRAFEMNPKNADALNFVGYSMAEKGQNLSEAKGLIQKAIALEPKNGYFIDSLGWVLFQEGKTNEAKAELEKAVALVPTDAVILEHLALVYEKLKDFEQALRTAKKALEDAPNSDDKDVGKRLQELLNRLEQSLQGGASVR